MKLNNQEKRELDKFAKFLALKSTQIIVQSRLGEKVSTACKPHTTGTDWFNLNINDLPEVLAEAKRVLNGEILSAHLPLCVEISLRTAEGDQMILETWCLGLSPDKCDSTARLIHSIYNRMGILLKSLVSVTRVVPAYKLSRRQDPESFVICYRIYMGEPQDQCLGDGFKHVRVGQICTPIGTFHLSVSYRTKMTISPTQAGRDNPILLKSDQYTNLSPGITTEDQNYDIDRTSCLSNIMKIGAFADSKKKNLDSHLIMPNTPFSKIFKEKLSPDKCSGSAEVKDKELEKIEKNVESPIPDSRMDSLTMVSTNDDFIMVDLKTPFANSNEKSELGKFYREWQSAPPLQAFVNLSPPEELDVAKQLETFESDLSQYDTLVQSLCSSPNNN
ncbi:hypothetical protein JTB14_024470 [Gonioctena quinquepunctata]|nr:hypothetical protein JTB14_024470 [Gonioctena quinquepunctata]